MTEPAEKPCYENRVFYGKYRCLRKIGNGSFGEVYMGVDGEGSALAIKIEETGSRDPRLRKEFEIYCSLKNLTDVPKVHWFGLDGDVRVMVMDFVGENLNIVDEIPSVSRVCKIGRDIIGILERLHADGIIHSDIKPENFLVRGDKIFIADFGLSSFFIDRKTGKHVEYSTKKTLTGTPRYASINNHMGLQQSRRDDLESLGYMLVYFIRGSLPWQGLKKNYDKKVHQSAYVNTMNKKITTSLDELCRGIPACFKVYLQYVKGLEFEERPNYKFLVSLFSGHGVN